MAVEYGVFGVGDIVGVTGEAGFKVAAGLSAVSGTADVVTGLEAVYLVVAGLENDAAATGSMVTAFKHGTPGMVTLRVWMPTSTASTIPIPATDAKNVHWIALGR